MGERKIERAERLIDIYGEAGAELLLGWPLAQRRSNGTYAVELTVDGEIWITFKGKTSDAAFAQFQTQKWAVASKLAEVGVDATRAIFMAPAMQVAE